MSDMQLIKSEKGECCANCKNASSTGFWYMHCDLYNPNMMVPETTKNMRCRDSYSPTNKVFLDDYEKQS